MTHSSDPVLPIVILPIAALEGGKATAPRPSQLPDLRQRQIEEFLRQTGKAENTQRVYRGQLERFAAWCNRSWLNVTPSDIGKYRRELKLKGLKPASVNHALNTLRSFYQWLRRSNGYPMNQPLPTDAIDPYQLNVSLINMNPLRRHTIATVCLRSQTFFRSPTRLLRNQPLGVVFTRAKLAEPLGRGLS